jgi:hypothetical protein
LRRFHPLSVDLKTGFKTRVAARKHTHIDPFVLNRFERIGAWTSLLIGLPTGVAGTIAGILLPVTLTGEGVFTMNYLLVNSIATFGMLLAFGVMLWIAGKNLGADIRRGTGMLRATYKYSIIVNSVIWTSFMIVHMLSNANFDPLYGFVLPLFMGLACIIITPFSIGMVIYYAAKTIIGDMEEARSSKSARI